MNHFSLQRRGWLYPAFYAAMIVASATVTLETAIGIIDRCYAIMAIPTMVSTLWLAPRAERYWNEPRRATPA